MSEALAGGITRFLQGLRVERRLSPHTESAYSRDLAALLEYCAAQGIGEWNRLDAQHVRSFAAQSHRRGLAPRSVQRRLSAIRSLFRFLAREGEVTHNPAADVPAPRARKRLPTTLDADTMARLLEFRADDRLGLRDKAIMELFYSSGLRLSELIGLDLADLDLRDRTVRVLGKGRKARIVPVGRRAAEALSRSARASCRSASPAGRGCRACPSTCTRTCSATPSPRTCSSRPVTCAPCRSCSATPTSAPRRSTPTLISSTSPGYTTQHIPGRGRKG